MIPIILDGNIYDLLAKDPSTLTLLKDRIAIGLLHVLAPRTIFEELLDSPFKGIPKWFPTEYVGNTVGNVEMSADDSMGEGEIFEAHLGNSRQLNDAYIADAADWMAEWLVSEDARLRRRMAAASTRCKALSYSDFRLALELLA